MPSTLNPKLNFNQTIIRSGGAHTNATPQQPANSGGAVTQITAGANITISPAGGTGNVTINGAAGGTGTVTHTAGNLTANDLIIGNAGADVKALGSLGTTTTVLHGNAAGAPSFAQVAVADMANMAAYTVMANNTGSAAAPIALTEEQFRTMFFQQQFYVDDYITAAAGAVLTGLNAAIAALNTATVGSLVFGPGTYAVNGAITAITAACEVRGCGWAVTSITQAGNDDGFVFTSTSPCYVHDFYISGPGATKNTGLTFGAYNSANSSSNVVRVECVSFLIGIAAVYTINAFSVRDCTIGCANAIVVGGYNNAGTVTVTPANGATLFPGSAAMICNCTPSGSTNGIWCLGPNGVLIQGCQLVSIPTAIRVTFQNTAARMSDLYILGNHIEPTGTGIILDANTNGVTNANQFYNLLINDNQFAPGGPGLYGIQTNSVTQYWLTRFSISGNVFLNCPSGCIYLEGMEYGAVTGNCFGTNQAVDNVFIDASCQYVTYGDNVLQGGSGYSDSSGGHTIATLPSAAANVGMRTWVSNGANAPAWNGAVGAAGGTYQPVFAQPGGWVYG